MKDIVKLPEPKNEDLIHHINGKLRDLEIEAGVKKFNIRTKERENDFEVIIIGNQDEISRAKKSLNDLIDNFLNTITIDLPKNELWKNKALYRLLNGKKESIESRTKSNIKMTQKQIHIKNNDEENRKQAAEEIRSYIDLVQVIKTTIPSELLGRIIGKQHSNIRAIEKSERVIIDIIKKDIHVSGEEMNCRKAILQLKTRAAEMIAASLSKRLSCDNLDNVNTKRAATESSIDFELKSTPCPNRYWDQTVEYFKITPFQDEEDENMDYGEVDVEQLTKFISNVLQKIQKGREGAGEGGMPKADLWCHFGHIYVSNVSEEEENDILSLKDLEEKFNQGKDGWKMLFDPAIKDMDIKELEDVLTAVSVPRHIRYDFQFLTPSCRKIRVKIFLNDDPDGQPNGEFSKEDIDIQDDVSVSSSPLYFLCDNFYHRAKVSITFPLCKMDVRMTVRTVAQNKCEDPKEIEFTETLRQYLDKITIRQGKVVWPDDRELPDDFCLSYLRKCKRRSYRYTQNDRSYSLTISEEDEMNVLDREEIKKSRTDIHIHSDEWDQMLLSGKWEPDRIVCNLKKFLEFLQDFQGNISVTQQDESPAC